MKEKKKIYINYATYSLDTVGTTHTTATTRPKVSKMEGKLKYCKNENKRTSKLWEKLKKAEKCF